MLNRHKNWLVHKQTACGKDFSNPFMVDNLPKIVGFSTHLASLVKSWLVQDQTVLALASPKANGIWLHRSIQIGTHTSPPLPVSSPVPVLSPSPPASPIHLLGYRAAMIRLRAEATSTSHLLPLPPPIILSHTRPDAPSSGTPPLHLLSTNHRADRPKDEILVDMPGALATDDTDMGRRMTEFTTRGRSMDASDLARAEVMSLRTQVVAQQAMITELHAADCRRQAMITEMLAADRKRQEQFIKALRLLKRLLTQMTEFKRQQGPARGPTQPDAPEEAGSSS
ncbi:hypothetical protein Tco_1002241 [Tanacetum coccineum]|uniref:Uncharacterized protein n=1 Tax=Tanacetum coccineum TaxID=301880 RepID=A0ABQ5F5S1_9ASTR